MMEVHSDSENNHQTALYLHTVDDGTGPLETSGSLRTWWLSILATDAPPTSNHDVPASRLLHYARLGRGQLVYRQRVLVGHSMVAHVGDIPTKRKVPCN